MRVTHRDNPVSELRDRRLPEAEVRALLCRVARTCERSGVERLREVVTGEEPVFYIDEAA